MKKEVISFRLNEKDFSCYIEDTVSLCEALYFGRGVGCNKEIVVVNGEAVDSCRFPVVRAIGRDVITSEWIKTNSRALELQNKLLAVLEDSCDKCVGNIIMLCLPLCAAENAPTRYKIASTLQGSLCCDIDINDVISVVTAAYNNGRITLPTQLEKQNKALEIMELKYVKKKDMPIQITSVESTVISPIATESAQTPVIMSPQPVAEKQEEVVEPTPIAVEPIVDDSVVEMDDNWLEPMVDNRPPQSEVVPVSIFDEGFAENYEGGKKNKKSDDKQKIGFFGKFSAAFKEKHHKTLEIPDVETEE